MMRLLFAMLFVQALFIFTAGIGQAAPNVSAANAILIDNETGEILFEKEAHEERPIASITKIMTALLAVESGKLDEQAVVSRKAIYTEGSSIYLEQGEKMKVNDLVYGLMLRSGNDAAVAIAEHIGGSEEGFIFLMNEKAAWLGMNHTHFTNPHGLDHEEHYSSAYDMAILMKNAMENKTFQEISASKIYKSATRSYSWQNKHKLVTGYYSNATGGKTGYTKRTGRTLVTSAEKDGQKLIAVTLNGPDDWNDHINLFEWGFDRLAADKSIDENSAFELTGKENQRVFNFMTDISDILQRMTGVKSW